MDQLGVGLQPRDATRLEAFGERGDERLQGFLEQPLVVGLARASRRARAVAFFDAARSARNWIASGEKPLNGGDATAIGSSLALLRGRDRIDRGGPEWTRLPAPAHPAMHHPCRITACLTRFGRSDAGLPGDLDTVRSLRQGSSEWLLSKDGVSGEHAFRTPGRTR